MTRAMRRLMLILQDEADATGTCPTYDEMRVACGLSSKSRIAAMVAGLERRGYIRRLPRCARSIEVVRRIEPIVQWRVWDAERQVLVPYYGGTGHGLSAGGDPGERDRGGAGDGRDGVQGLRD